MESVEDLERRIDDLAAAVENSRRLTMGGRVACFAGVGLLIAPLIGLMWFNATTFVIAVASWIGGMVLSGSSSSSTRELETRLRKAEAERTAAIDAMDLQPLP